MKKTIKAKKIDRTTPRVLTANDLQGITGGSTEVMNNPLYQGADTAADNPLYASATVANNPLYEASGSEGNNPLHKG